MTNDNDNIQIAREWLASSRSLTVLTGDGISTESGIPTYSDTLESFQNDPKLVWDRYHTHHMQINNTVPTATHEAIHTICNKAMVSSILTQNVDGLHGWNAVELHGSIWRTRCTNCLCEWKNETLIDYIPYCNSCHSLARPAVTWAGEALNPIVWERAVAATYCDTMLVVGTGLVDPVSSLPMQAQKNRARIIEVNLERTSIHANIFLQGNPVDIVPQLITSGITSGRLSNYTELDMSQAIIRGLEKFYAKHPHLKSET